jgi:poly-gamma-glutamate synthesis protein (capsule biosynthesis protein)
MMHVPDGFTLAAVGDLIITHPVSSRNEPGLQSLVKILGDADVTFGNFETNAIDFRTFTGYAQAEMGGAWLRSDPRIVGDLRAMGFDLLNRANNHATDWGLEGMRETDRRLDEAGIAHAGTGEDRAAARAAGYLSTPYGRVAIVGMASSFTPISRSAPALGEVRGRPGVNALRTIRRVLVTRDMMAGLKRIHAAQPKGSYPPPSDSSSGDLDLLGVRYRVSDSLKDQVRFSYDMDSVDVREILAATRQGKMNADFLVATIHAHEPGNWSTEPPDFLPKLAHAAIDQGADAFIAHGPHQLRGIEIYRGRPIFYSLANFFFQVGSVEPIAADLYEQFDQDPVRTVDAELNRLFLKRFFQDSVYYQSVIAVSKYHRGNVSEIRLYPVELGFGEREADRGVPHEAPPAVARVILERLQQLSRLYGTAIAIEQNVGVIRPGPAGAADGAR